MKGPADHIAQEKRFQSDQSVNPDPDVLAQALSDTSGLPFEAGEIVQLEDVAHKEDVADATLKYTVRLPAGGAGFLIVSGAGNPDLIDRAVINITTLRAVVSPSVAAPVLPPDLSGRAAGRSFALWPVREQFLAESRIRRLVRRYRYAGPVCSWHRALLRETLAPAEAGVFHRNLEFIRREPEFAGDMHQAAGRALSRLEAGDWAPLHCLQHGDFWIGNILLPQAGDKAPFHVIDWAGMNRSGYPFADLCRILLSLRCSRWFAAKQITALRTQTGCAPEDVTGFVLSGLGHTGQHLEHFPPDRFRAKALNVYRFAAQFQTN